MALRYARLPSCCGDVSISAAGQPPRRACGRPSLVLPLTRPCNAYLTQGPRNA